METTINLSTYQITKFLNTNINEWLEGLIKHTSEVMNEEPGYSQIKAWKDCYYVLQKEFEKVNFHSQSYFIFKYELKRERGRRPDVLLLSGSTVYILEFKQHSEYEKARVDQANLYARNIQFYHKNTHDLNVEALLVLTRSNEYLKEENDVTILSKNKICTFFSNKLDKPFEQDIQKWYDSPYEPSPSIVKYVKDIFNHKKLPQIKKASSAGIPETLRLIKQIINNETIESQYNLILLTGSSGARKTLVGLNYVYNAQNQKALFYQEITL